MDLTQSKSDSFAIKAQLNPFMVHHSVDPTTLYLGRLYLELSTISFLLGGLNLIQGLHHVYLFGYPPGIKRYKHFDISKSLFISRSVIF